MRTGTRKLAARDDQVFIADRPAIEPAFEHLAHTGRIARLCRQCRAGRMRSHAVVRHRTPGMIERRWLWKPYVASIARKLTAFERAHDRITIAYLSARGIDDIGAAFHLADHRVVEQVFGLRMKWRVYRHHV